MPALKELLRSLEGQPNAKLELMSGRRPRVVKNGDMKNLADEALTDEEVLELCRQAGGGRRLDDISEKPITWEHPSSVGLVSVSASLRGREIFATVASTTREPTLHQQGSRPSKRAMKAVRNEAASRGAAPPKRPSREMDPARDRPTDAPPKRKAASPTPRPGFAPPARESESKRATRRPPTPTVTRRDIPVRTEPAGTRGGQRPVEEGPRPPKEAPIKLELASGPEVAAARASGSLLDLIAQAKRLGASDLHLWVGAPPHARTSAGLRAVAHRPPLSRQEIDRAFSALIPPSLVPHLHRDGGATFTCNVDETTRVRVNATNTLEGPKLSLRLLHAHAPTFEELGLPLELVRATEQPQGLVVITGPSGHGKTTTVAALVERINESRAAHIVMVEDPLEIPIVSKRSIVSQREIGPHAKSFERALKGALRQDPDVIVIGELRDVETVRIALTASETGHLVLGTMNTPSTKAVIDRLIDLFPHGDQPQVRHTLAGGLRMICNQRLLDRAGEGGGRVAAFELVPGSPALWNLIREDKTFQIPSLLQRGRGAGIVRLADSLASLVRRSAITRDVALKAADDPGELARSLDGPAPDPLRPREADVASAHGSKAAEESALGGLISKAGAIFSRRGGA